MNSISSVCETLRASKQIFLTQNKHSPLEPNKFPTFLHLHSTIHLRKLRFKVEVHYGGYTWANLNIQNLYNCTIYRNCQVIWAIKLRIWLYSNC